MENITPTTPEISELQLKRKEYNKKYYAEHKKQIIEKLCSKVECPFCNRLIIYNHLEKHKKTALCKRFQNIKINDKIRKDQEHERVIEKNN